MPVRTRKRRTPEEVKAAADRAQARSSGTTRKPKKKAAGKKTTRAPKPAPVPTPIEPTAPLVPGVVTHRVGGRPTTYRPEYVAIARAMCKLGATDADLAAEFDCTTQTIYNWSARHKEFFDAIHEGKESWDARIERSLAQRAAGYSYSATKIMQHSGVPVVVEYMEHVPPDTSACLSWLANRKPHEWRTSNNRHEVVGKDGGPIEMDDTRRKLELARWMAFVLNEGATAKQIEGRVNDD